MIIVGVSVHGKTLMEVSNLHEVSAVIVSKSLLIRCWCKQMMLHSPAWRHQTRYGAISIWNIIKHCYTTVWRQNERLTWRFELPRPLLINGLLTSLFQSRRLPFSSNLCLVVLRTWRWLRHHNSGDYRTSPSQILTTTTTHDNSDNTIKLLQPKLSTILHAFKNSQQ